MVQTNKLTLCYELVNNENMGYIDNQLNKNDLPNIGTILKATTTLDSLQTDLLGSKYTAVSYWLCTVHLL